MNLAEKEAAKAAKLAEKEAAKAANDSASEDEGEEQSSPEVPTSPLAGKNPWELIDGPGVKCDLKGVHPGSKSYAMASVLALQPKVSTFIPLADNEKPGLTTASVILNGFRVEILKGQYVDLPRQVHETLAESYAQTIKAITQTMVKNPMSGETVNSNLNMRSSTDRQHLNA